MLWAAQGSDSLSVASRRAIAAGPLWLSVITYWEVVIKSGKGRLQVGDPQRWWEQAVTRLGARVLPLTEAHIAEARLLPPLHQDPFDRALIAQAIAEEMTLVTPDRGLGGYASPGCHFIH